MPDLMTREDMPAAVQAGIALLDEKVGGPWREEIDLDRLNLRWHDDCVLGQLFSGYSDGMRILEIEDPNTVGFDAYSYMFSETFSIYGGADPWDALTKEWVKALTPRSGNA
jgi:hypothetical protein